jgi:hypothetical protein
MAPERKPSPEPRAAKLFAQLVAVFAATMGTEKAESVVREALRELGIDPWRLDDGAIRAVLAHLTAQNGIVGVTARVAVTQRSRIRATGKLQVYPSPPPEPPRTGVHRRPSPAPAPQSTAQGDASESQTGIHPEDIAAAFGASLDPQQALALVRKYWISARIVGNTCTRERALALLEEMRSEAGQAGVAATFAKARLHMAKAK